jgi:hypothetical protein
MGNLNGFEYIYLSNLKVPYILYLSSVSIKVISMGTTGVNLDLADMKSIDFDNSLFGVTSFDSDIVNNVNRTHDYDRCKGQRMTAITKLQVMLNEVVNNHKASLKIHDDIMHLFVEYNSSPSFDK